MLKTREKENKLSEFGIKATNFNDLPKRVTVQTGVQVDTSGLRTIGAGIRSAFGGSKKKKETNLNPLLDHYTKTSDAVNQGKMTQADAAIQNRAYFKQWGAANPNDISKGLAFTKSYTGGSPAVNLTKESPQESQRKKDLKEGLSLGFGGDDISDEDVVRKYRNYQVNIKELELTSKKLAIAKARNGVLASSEKRIAMKAIGNLVPAHYEIFGNQVRGIINQATQDPAFKPEAIKQINEMFTTRFVSIANKSRKDGLSEGQINGFLKPFKDLRDRSIDRINGKIDADVYEGEVKLRKAQLKALLLSNDPKALAAAVHVSLYGESNLKLLGVSPDNYEKIRKLAEGLTQKKTGVDSNSPNYRSPTIPNVADPHKAKEVKSMSKITNDAYRRVQKKDPNERKGVLDKLSSEVDQTNLNWLKSFNMYDKTSDNPKDWKEAVKHVASPEFGAWMKKNGSNLPPNVRKKAYDSVVRSWTNIINPLLEKRYKEIKSVASIQEFVDVKYTSDGVVFSIKDTPETKKLLSTKPNSDTFVPVTASEKEAYHKNKTNILRLQTIQDGIDKLNKEVAPLLNTNIRMSSHLTSNNPEDYTGEWTKNYAEKFGGVVDNKPSGKYQDRISGKNGSNNPQYKENTQPKKDTSSVDNKTTKPTKEPKLKVDDKTVVKPAASKPVQKPSKVEPTVVTKPKPSVTKPTIQPLKKLMSESEMEFEVNHLRGIERSKALAKLRANNVRITPTSAPPPSRGTISPTKAINSSTPDLVKAVIAAESSGNPNAVSPKGAAGIMQVMPATAREIARELGDKNLPKTDAEITKYLQNKSIGMKYGKHYLNKQLKAFKGDVAAALVAYNAGPVVAKKWLDSGKNMKVLPKETQGYLNKILSTPTQGNTSSGRLIFAHPRQEAGVKPKVKRMLNNISSTLGKPLKVTSGHRSSNHPVEVKKKKPGQHTVGNAVDINMSGMSNAQRTELVRLAKAQGFNRFIAYSSSPNMLHIDIGSSRTNKGKLSAMFDRSVDNYDKAPSWYKKAFDS